jgi:hypothetical protein
MELIHAPIFGPGSEGAIKPRPAHLWAFILPQEWAQARPQKVTIDETLTVLHGVWVGDLDGDGRDEILTASFEGIHRFDLQGSLLNGSWNKTLISSGAEPVSSQPGVARGSSEISPGRQEDGTAFYAAIEPWHGNQVVFYTAAEEGQSWKRQLLDDSLKEGHALQVADFDGDGSDEIVAGWRGAEGGLRIYDQIGSSGRFRKIDIDHGIAVEGLAAADINSSSLIDLVALGGRTNNLVWYENLSDSK